MPSPSMSGQGLRGATVITALGLMVGAPVAALDEQRPSPLGWHMYSGNIHSPEITVTTADGSEESLDINDVAAKYRPEADYFEPVARFLCAEEADIRAVELTRTYPAATEEFTCASF